MRCLYFVTTVFVVASLPLQCPEYSHRKLRAEIFCNVSSGKQTYACLFDDNDKQVTEQCMAPDYIGPDDSDINTLCKFRTTNYKLPIEIGRWNNLCREHILCTRGHLRSLADGYYFSYTFVMRGMLDRESCAFNTFQPFINWTNESSDCVYIKSTCSGDGQIIFENGTKSTDRTCRCDYRRNYAFLQTPLNSCYCRPKVEDCSCYIKTCPFGYVLRPDYACLLVSEWTGKFNCPEIKEAQHTIRILHPENKRTKPILTSSENWDNIF